MCILICTIRKPRTHNCWGSKRKLFWFNEDSTPSLVNMECGESELAAIAAGAASESEASSSFDDAFLQCLVATPSGSSSPESFIQDLTEIAAATTTEQCNTHSAVDQPPVRIMLDAGHETRDTRGRKCRRFELALQAARVDDGAIADRQLPVPVEVEKKPAMIRPVKGYSICGKELDIIRKHENPQRVLVQAHVEQVLALAQEHIVDESLPVVEDSLKTSRHMFDDSGHAVTKSSTSRAESLSVGIQSLSSTTARAACLGYLADRIFRMRLEKEFVKHVPSTARIAYEDIVRHDEIQCRFASRML